MLDIDLGVVICGMLSLRYLCFAYILVFAVSLVFRVERETKL